MREVRSEAERGARVDGWAGGWGGFRPSVGWEVGVTACGDCPRLQLGCRHQQGKWKGCTRLGLSRVEPRRAGPLCPCWAWHTGPEVPEEGSLNASGVLCRESLAERDKLQCASTSPGSLELPEHILMGPIQLSLRGN